MASTNQSPQYQKAQGMYLHAKTNEEKLKWLEEMMKECPKHKSSEKMLANLKTRYIKLKSNMERISKTKKFSRRGIKKEEMQAIIVGFSNSGKSSLLSLLTNTNPEIASYRFTTKEPVIGMLNHNGVQIQMIENPAIESEYYDKGITHGTDTVLILINHLEDLLEIEKKLQTSAKKIIVFNIKDKAIEKRRLEATLKSKKLNFVIINTEEQEGIEELKQKIFSSFDKIRIYTKEPGKPKSDRPIILNPDSNVKDVAEKIFHGFSKQIKETFITGPSSKFPNQKVGLTHELKDLDVVEFKTR